MNQLDYPIHQIIKSLQTRVLNRLFNNDVISRIHNNELRFNSDQEIFRLFELFSIVNDIVWEELNNNYNINSFRRELQNYHIDLLDNIYKNNIFPVDAQNLALQSMNQIYSMINKQDLENIYDHYTVSHLISMKNKIELALDINSSDNN